MMPSETWWRTWWAIWRAWLGLDDQPDDNWWTLDETKWKLMKLDGIWWKLAEPCWSRMNSGWQHDDAWQDLMKNLTDNLMRNQMVRKRWNPKENLANTLMKPNETWWRDLMTNLLATWWEARRTAWWKTKWPLDGTCWKTWWTIWWKPDETYGGLMKNQMENSWSLMKNLIKKPMKTRWNLTRPVDAPDGTLTTGLAKLRQTSLAD